MPGLGALQVLLAILAMAGCNAEKNATTPQPQPAAAAGRFIAVYEPAAKADAQREATLWRERRLLDDFVEAMNEAVRIPRDIKVVAKECGEANAFYDPDAHVIEMCYELSAEERELFTDAGDSGEELEQELYESAVGTLYHELGHALIGELELKITGKEEDVADQMAAYVLTADEESKDYLITVADTYALAASQAQKLDDLPFYGIHSLDAQRSINFLCYVYGSDPEAFKYLVKDGSLPEERAEYCETEYVQFVDAWDALLAPHLKPESPRDQVAASVGKT